MFATIKSFKLSRFAALQLPLRFVASILAVFVLPASSWCFEGVLYPKTSYDDSLALQSMPKETQVSNSNRKPIRIPMVAPSTDLPAEPCSRSIARTFDSIANDPNEIGRVSAERKPRRIAAVESTPWSTEPFAVSLHESLRSFADNQAETLIPGSPLQSEAQLASSISPQAPPEPLPPEPLPPEPLPLAISQQIPVWANDFSPTPLPSASQQHRPDLEVGVYDDKGPTPTQAPWIEWGRPFYGTGITPRGNDVLGDYNMVRPSFYLYGDFRTGIAAGRNDLGRTDNWASRLNLDADLKITDTERFHAFVAPLGAGVKTTRWELQDEDLSFRNEVDFTPITGFFEGDLGVMTGAASGHSADYDLPFTVGLVPLLFQNGIWMEDAVTGAAFALPARHSTLLNWSNYDATFFAVVDQLNSPAFGQDENAAQAFGTAWFIEAYGGYIETGYAFVRDRNVDALSYHNATISFTRRYLDRISNSVRLIVNSGQDLAEQQRTADGGVLLVENSWITSDPLRFVPYANFFYGWDRPQSVARAIGSGGILRSTGINFDTDGLSGLATLDTTASDTAGGSVGVDLIGDKLERQWLVEASYQSPHGNKNANVPDDQYGLGTRYQFPVSHRTLIRMDATYGWRGDLNDVYGTRLEYRWKF
jgi:hypothetical protein